MYLVAIGTETLGTTILTLPLEYRPNSMRYCDITVSNGSGTDETQYTIRVTVGADGVIALAHGYTHKATHPYMIGTLVFSI